MPKYPRDKGRKGSEKWLQKVVNECPYLLDREIYHKLMPSPSKIQWLSPLEADNYSEYSDKDFLDRLEISLLKFHLNKFWPDNGPRWDGLGKTDREQILLVEAKSHVAELVSTTGASDPSSLKRIHYSLNETKQYIHRVSDKPVHWHTGVFQYANRLAHLYLLRVLNGLDAYLVLLCFLNDKEREADDTHVPETPAEWEAVIKYQDRLMGIRQRHPLSDRIIHVFIDVNDIEANQ